MNRRIIPVLAAALIASAHPQTRGDGVDGRVIQVRLPDQDVTLFYTERRGGFTAELRTATASVEAQRMYLGDGRVALELVAHPSDGIFLQQRHYRQGTQLRRGSTIPVRPDAKQAADLQPGDLYVILPGVTFQVDEP